MTTLKKYNLDGKEKGSVKVDSSLLADEINEQMIKDYIVAMRQNARQWSACVKSRAEVSHTTKKPHPQKGTGGARQGSLVAPHFRGGGRAFGPKPKFNQSIRVNKKERRAAIRFLLSEKIKENRVKILESTAIDAPKTKAVAAFLKNSDCTGRVLFVGEGAFADVEAGEGTTRVSVKSDVHGNFVKSLRNIPKVEFSLAQNINGYDVMLARDIVMTESALNEMTEWLKIRQ